MRIAAELGPGYLGKRRAALPVERAALAEEFRKLETPVPQFLDREPRWIERRAKLFEAGDYPDKGISVTLGDLERLVENFDLPVPVLIEHADSPLELGYLTSVSVEEGQLFGLVALTEEANALIERSGAHSLSIGLSQDLEEIREVSLVRNPRVKSAKLFSELVVFDTVWECKTNWRARYEALRNQHRADQVRSQVQTLIAKGQLTPAQAPIAAVLLQRTEAVEFAGDELPLADLVMKLIGAQPKHGMLGEKAPQPVEDTSSVLMLPEEAAFYRRHFPDVSLESIAQKRTGRI